jgi:hypothetical protein
MYKVIVNGACLYETEDELLAYAIRNSYRSIGWKNVHVRGVKNGH